MQQDNHTHATAEPSKESRQDRVCNILAFVGLLTITVLGGSSIITPLLKPGNTAPQPPELPSAPSEASRDSLADMGDEPLPAPLPETTPDTIADSLSVGTIDTLALSTPAISTDSTTHHHPAHTDSIHHHGHHHTDSLRRAE